MKENLLEQLICLNCDSHELSLSIHERYADKTIKSGQIECKHCGQTYKIAYGVPIFVETEELNTVFDRTADHYGTGWVEGNEATKYSLEEKWHFDELVNLFEFPVNQTGFGLEGGSGNGKDTVRLALNNPKSEIITIDISDGAFVASERCRNLQLKNVNVIKASLHQIPLRDGFIDFGYSFGVLHHMPNPQEGANEISRVMKSGSKFLTYLYSDLSERPLLKLLLKPITFLRRVTLRLNLNTLKVFCYLLMPIVFLLLTLPARFLKLIGFNKLAQKIPYHHNLSFQSLYGELYDRFGAQIEFRYNPETLDKLYDEAGFKMINHKNLEIWRGWVSIAQKQ